MKASEYPRFFEFETTYWWFRGLHSILLQVLDGLGIGADALVLDAGCGTGTSSRRFATTPMSGCSASTCRPRQQNSGRRELSTVWRASVNAIPLECDEVETVAAYRELWRTAKPGRWLILSMPAHHSLGNEIHNATINGSRRFERKELAAIVHTCSAKIEKMTHLFPFFLPAVAAWRAVAALGPRSGKTDARADLFQSPKWINELLFLLTQA